RDAGRVGDEDAEEDGPEDVLDVGEGDVVGLGPGVEEGFDELAGVANEEEEGDAGEEAEEGGALGWAAARGVGRVLGAKVWEIGGGGHGVLLGFLLGAAFCWWIAAAGD